MLTISFQATAFAVLALTLSSQTALSAQHTIEVSISNVISPTGSMMLAVYHNAETFLSDDCVRSAKVRVNEDGVVKMTIADLPSGEYAMALFHDVNGNDVVDKNLLGIPTEPYGFSNNARGRFGPPKFNAAKFAVNQKHQKIEIALN